METIETLLRKNGSKATPGRVAILSVLQKKCIPLSINEISASLPVKLNQTTIYRTLESLTDSEIIRRVELGHAHAHYEMVEKQNHHHHIICKECGKIEDVRICGTEEMESSVLKKSKLFHNIKSHALEFFGVCNGCVKN
ncbi:MAG: Fur family transcriptional regulator [Candidatus Parcubacteria bacterium]|nr:Fur family transcriptional regulator [Candidatus Parcubacteria bacterium]